MTDRAAVAPALNTREWAIPVHPAQDTGLSAHRAISTPGYQHTGYQHTGLSTHPALTDQA
jgi:hypothetical protein